MEHIEQIIYLPGASGNARFWKPVADKLAGSTKQVLASYPCITASQTVTLDEVVDTLEGLIDRPSAIVAQSMGGIVAVRLAAQQPELVSHLVLAATSGGIDTSQFGALDWRTSYPGQRLYPQWLVEYRYDLSETIRALSQPTLLLWGGSDPFSPRAVGMHLSSLFSKAKLHVFDDGDHEFASSYAPAVADLISAHLARR